MTDSIHFLSLDQVLLIHRRVVEEFGGIDSIRSNELLESAIATPATQFGGKYLHGSAAAMAAAYLYHICKNHPFMDGNKRTALATSEAFLNVNGFQLNATNKELEVLTLQVASSAISKEETIDFFHSHTCR